jgi:chromate transporter
LLLAPLSLVAVGGVNTVLPEIHRQVVQGHGWLTEAEFADLFALAQAAPGPNIALLVSLLGWKVAGVAGTLTALLSMCVPSSLVAYGLTRAWHRFRNAPWRRPVQAGLAPVAVGLVLASGAILTAASDHSGTAYIVTGVSTALVLGTRLHPLLLLGAAALLAILGAL